MGITRDLARDLLYQLYKSREIFWKYFHIIFVIVKKLSILYRILSRTSVFTR